MLLNAFKLRTSETLYENATLAMRVDSANPHKVPTNSSFPPATSLDDK